MIYTSAAAILDCGEKMKTNDTMKPLDIIPAIYYIIDIQRTASRRPDNL